MSGARRGQLAGEPLPALLHALHRDRLTGVLALEAAGGRAEVFLRGGYPVGVSSTGAIDMLGQVLVDAGLLDEETRAGLAAACVTDGVSFGRSLVVQGLITDEQLREALLQQTRRRLHRLFFLERGGFSVEPREHAVGVDAGEVLRIHPRRAIYQGIRNAWTPERAKRALAPLDGKALKLAVDRAQLDRYAFSDGDGEVAARLAERPRTVEELQAASGRPIEAVRAVALALHFTEAVVAVAVEAAAARPTARTPPGAPAAPDLAGLRQQIAARLAAAEAGDLPGLIGVADDATREQVKAAYLQVAKVFHPDRFGANGLEPLRPDVEKLLRHLNEAYAILSDEQRRAAWREKRAAAAAGAGADPADERRARAAVDAEVAFLQGKVLLKKRDFAAAVAAFQRAVELAPSEGEHLAMHAWARVAAGQVSLPSIKPDLAQAIAKSPRCAPAHHFMGVVLREEGDLDGAIHELKKALAIDPQLSEAESELRLVTLRREKQGRGGLFRKK